MRQNKFRTLRVAGLVSAAVVAVYAVMLLTTTTEGESSGVHDIRKEENRETENIASDIEVAKELRSKLISQRVSEDSAKFAVLGYLEAISSIPEEYPYWKAGLLKELHLRVGANKRQEYHRAILLEVFGASAASDPVFAKVFRPLQSRLPFLAPDKQVAIAKVISDAMAARLSDTTLRSGPEAWVRSNQAAEAQLTAVKQVLTDQEFFEYQLRESPLAQRLTAIGFEFTEQEFRGVFQILRSEEITRKKLSDAPHAVPSIGSDATETSDEKVRAVLGEQRFREYRRAQDPRYSMLRAVAYRHQLSVESTNAAYEIVRRADDSMARTAIPVPGVRFDGAREVRNVTERRNDELQKLLGFQVAKEVSAALSMFQSARMPLLPGAGAE